MKNTTTKRIIAFCLINGVLWVWCSYLLAYLGREEIAESLSQAAVTEIIGVVLVYCCKALFENLAKHNDWLNKSSVVSRSQNKNQDCD